MRHETGTKEWKGGGSFGDVYRGEHVLDKTSAAVKVLRARLTNERDWGEFINEARTFRLHHPHIIKLLDFGVQRRDGTPFLIMNYAPKGSLREHHPRGVLVSLATVITYVKQIASALQYIHNERLIHRDIKPENILVGEQGELVVSDFGSIIVSFSKQYDAQQEVIGSPLYMSPEQFDGEARSASDQYSLAIVVYEWLCGRLTVDAWPRSCLSHMRSSWMSERERVHLYKCGMPQLASLS